MIIHIESGHDSSGDNSWLDSVLTPEVISQVYDGPPPAKVSWGYDSGWLDSALTPDMVARVVFDPQADDKEENGIDAFDVATANTLYNSLGATSFADLQRAAKNSATPPEVVPEDSNFDGYGKTLPNAPGTGQDGDSGFSPPSPSDEPPPWAQWPGFPEPNVDWGALIEDFKKKSGAIDAKENETKIKAN